jgi:hypothetical protein
LHHPASPSIVADAGARGCHGRADARVAVDPVEAVACEKTHPPLPLAGYEAVADVLDIVNYWGPTGGLVARVRKQGSIMPGRFTGGLVRHSTARRWHEPQRIVGGVAERLQRSQDDDRAARHLHHGPDCTAGSM